MADVSAALSSSTRVSLVVRRHVDFKRVCSCCCLP
ncbi:MAG: Ms4527A family Cys-rich leader peptide [Mycobacterium sp.]